jgi:ubiquinone/menaquinone biosynthesis C-methylase UbiE
MWWKRGSNKLCRNSSVRRQSVNEKFQRRIQRYGWDKAADHYEAGWKLSLQAAQRELLRLAAARPGEHVLDIASGTGLVAFPLAEAVGASGRVTATDISERMVESLQDEARRRGITIIEAFRADAEVLDMLPDHSFDLVTCALGLMYFSEPMKAMKHVTRLLKSGGRAVFAVWGERKNCGWADIFPIVDARVQSSVCPMFFRLGTGRALQSEMEQVGFRDVQEIRIKTELPYPNEASALSAAFAGGPVALAYDRFDAPTRESAHVEYLASIKPYRTDKGYRIPGEFVVCSGQVS